MKRDSEERLVFEILSGNPNNCIAINDTRITSAKLWGFGHIIRRFTVSKDKIASIIENKDKVTFHLLDHGIGGVFVDGVRITNNGTKTEYKKYLEKKAELLKRINKSLSKKRCREYTDLWTFVVDTKNIKENFLQIFLPQS